MKNDCWMSSPNVAVWHTSEPRIAIFNMTVALECLKLEEEEGENQKEEEGER